MTIDKQPDPRAELLRAHDKALAALPDWEAIANRVATIVAERPPKLYYSPGTRGFYHNTVHVVIPTDVVEIEEKDWLRLLDAQKHGMEIVPDTDGHPTAVDPESRPEEKAARVRHARNQLLIETDALVARHRDQLETGVTTTLSKETYATLQSWRYGLRQMTKDPNWPYVDLPPRPTGV